MSEETGTVYVEKKTTALQARWLKPLNKVKQETRLNIEQIQLTERVQNYKKRRKPENNISVNSRILFLFPQIAVMILLSLCKAYKQFNI